MVGRMGREVEEGHEDGKENGGDEEEDDDEEEDEVNVEYFRPTPSSTEKSEENFEKTSGEFIADKRKEGSKPKG
jgi:hypothetical protein